jgi:hypothetical protein
MVVAAGVEQLGHAPDLSRDSRPRQTAILSLTIERFEQLRYVELPAPMNVRHASSFCSPRPSVTSFTTS